MMCLGALVFNGVSILMFCVLPFDSKIVENNVFSDIQVCAAWCVQNDSIYQVISLIL